MLLRSLQQQATLLKLKLQGKEKPSHLIKLWRSLPDSYSRSWRDYQYLCVDLEFSDLQSAQGDLLSIGWVAISEGKLKLNTAKHYYIKNRYSVGQSASIHHIRDSDAAKGMKIDEAFTLFLQACEEKILVFHHANLDLSYLNTIGKKLYGSAIHLPYCDTLALEKAKLNRRHEGIPPGELRLQACRNRYQLPLYPQHNALVDAIATGELFLALLSRKAEDASLKRLISMHL